MDSEFWAADFFYLALAPEEITRLAGSPTKVEAPTVFNFLEEDQG